MTKASLGTSPISSIPYILSLNFPLTLGNFTIIFSVFLILLQILILRKNFKLENILQIPVSISFLFFGRLNGVREGTIIAALLVGFIARLFGKYLEFIKPYIFPEDYKTDEPVRVADKSDGETRHKNVIVIGRQYGSGGHDIGKILADKLEFSLEVF